MNETLTVVLSYIGLATALIVVVCLIAYACQWCGSRVGREQLYSHLRDKQCKYSYNVDKAALKNDIDNINKVIFDYPLKQNVEYTITRMLDISRENRELKKRLDLLEKQMKGME